LIEVSWKIKEKSVGTGWLNELGRWI